MASNSLEAGRFDIQHCFVGPRLSVKLFQIDDIRRKLRNYSRMVDSGVGFCQANFGVLQRPNLRLHVEACNNL